MVRLAKVDHKTVGAVRDKLVANGEIPDKAERTETNGRKARGRKPSTPKARAVPTPEAATPKPPASQARDKAVVEFARLLHSKPFETLDDLNRMLAGETGKIEEISQDKRVALASRYLAALGVSTAELASVGDTPEVPAKEAA